MTDQQVENQPPTPVEEMTYNVVPDVENGVYPAVCTAFELAHGKSRDTGEDESYYSWGFAVQVGDTTEDLRGSSSLFTSPGAKTTKWTVALVGAARMKDRNVKLNPQEDIVGAACMVEVAANDSGYPKVINVMPPLR